MRGSFGPPRKRAQPCGSVAKGLTKFMLYSLILVVRFLLPMSRSNSPAVGSASLASIEGSIVVVSRQALCLPRFVSSAETCHRDGFSGPETSKRLAVAAEIVLV